MGWRLGIVQINVTDLEEAWRFYVDTLGFVGTRPLGPNHAFELQLDGAGPTVLVYPVEQQAPAQYPLGTGVTLVFHTDSIRDTVERWRAKGVEFVPIAWSREATGIAPSPFGPFIAFKDPFGNVHELLEPTPPGQGGAP